MKTAGNLALKMVEQEQSSPKALAEEWGWKQPPEEILTLAKEAIEAKDAKSGELFVKGGHITQAQCDALLKSKPANAQTITWFAQQDAKCASVAERLIALKAGIPFYDDMRLLSLHEKMKDPTVIRRAEEFDVALMMIEGERAVLVFTSTLSLYKFKTMGRQDRSADPIVRAVGSDTELLLAIGVRDEVSEILKTVRVGDADGGPNDGTAIWVAAANTSPEAREFSRLIDHAMMEGATDVALEPKRHGLWGVRIRRNGILVKPKSASEKISAELAASMRMMLEKASGANPNNVEMRVPTDGRMTYRSSTGEAELRLSFIPTNHSGDRRNSKSVSIRLMDNVAKSVDIRKLNLHPKVIKELDFILMMGQGLGIVCGPTNSGKSTTVAGVVGMYMERYGEERKVLTVENPIERPLEGVTQCNAPKEAMFEELLKAFKRHDPDFIWVGEVRDRGTAETFVDAGAAGNFAITTLHANDSVMGFEVLARRVPPEFYSEYVESMAFSLGQRLVPQVCPHCRQESKPSSRDGAMYEKYLKHKGMAKAPKLPLVIAKANPKGCKHCDGGHTRELPMSEILLFSRVVKDAAMALLERRQIDGQSPRAVMEKERVVSLFDSGFLLLTQKKIDLESMLSALPA